MINIAAVIANCEAVKQFGKKTLHKIKPREV